ncbi:hypothetical protein F5876DRAFT_75089 [Lentinula aff. lateritia]|uniref:Uncharacterized protein n=1 Tax=Lentinula aff. lateritia TaxID=2804960 RepID=A0ACC1U651_9AGAR|nr:hypothetical protein F5876DRAFT_75089 [Lentinula aff. lateritia]
MSKPYSLTKIYKHSYTKDQYEFAKAQISDILSTLAAYELPDDSGNILKILTGISYARSLKIKLVKQCNSSVFPYPLHSVPSAHAEQDYLQAEMEVSDTIIRLERLGVKEAMSVRNEYTSEEGTLGLKTPEFCDVFPASADSKIACAFASAQHLAYDLPPLVFPDPDLLSHLVDLYFEKRNTELLLIMDYAMGCIISTGISECLFCQYVQWGLGIPMIYEPTLASYGNERSGVSVSMNSFRSYDLDFPVDCDDEYWSQPGEQAFQQPAGKPSTVSSWIHFLKQLDIFGLAQRSIVGRLTMSWSLQAHH